MANEEVSTSMKNNIASDHQPLLQGDVDIDDATINDYGSVSSSANGNGSNGNRRHLRVVSFNILVGSPISSIIGAPPLMAPSSLPFALITTLYQWLKGRAPTNAWFHYRQRHRFKLQLAQLSAAPMPDIIALQEAFCPRVRAVYREWATSHGYECSPPTARDDRGYYYGGRIALYMCYILFTFIFVLPIRWLLSSLLLSSVISSRESLWSATWPTAIIWLASFIASRMWFRGSTLECYLMGDYTGLLTIYNPATVGHMSRWYHESYRHRGGDPLNRVAPRSYLVTEWNRPQHYHKRVNDITTVSKLRMINTHMNMVGGELHRGPQLRELLTICGDQVQSSSHETYTDIICGDFNTRPTASEMTILHNASFISCVHPNQPPLDTIFGRQLDHILMRSADGGVFHNHAAVYCHNPPSSDHRAVITTIKWQ